MVVSSAFFQLTFVTDADVVPWGGEPVAAPLSSHQVKVEAISILNRYLAERIE